MTATATTTAPPLAPWVVDRIQRHRAVLAERHASEEVAHARELERRRFASRLEAFAAFREAAEALGLDVEPSIHDLQPTCEQPVYLTHWQLTLDSIPFRIRQHDAGGVVLVIVDEQPDPDLPGTITITNTAIPIRTSDDLDAALESWWSWRTAYFEPLPF